MNDLILEVEMEKDQRERVKHMFKLIKLCMLNTGTFLYQLCLNKIVPKNGIQKLSREIGISWELTIGYGLKETSFGNRSLKKKQC